MRAGGRTYTGAQLVFMAVAFAVTILFRANVDAQGGAYATGVLVLITSAAAAVTISAWGTRAGYAKCCSTWRVTRSSSPTTARSPRRSWWAGRWQAEFYRG